MCAGDAEQRQQSVVLTVQRLPGLGEAGRHAPPERFAPALQRQESLLEGRELPGVAVIPSEVPA